jgi:DNA topoisomerase-3
LTHYENVTKCNDTSCNLVIFKTICGKKLTEQQVVELVQKGKTGIIKGFKGKHGKSFEAALRFDDDFKVSFEFSIVPDKPK